jgi:hypothetical protein
MMRDRFTDEQERARSALFHLDPGCPREEWVKHAMAAKAAGLDFEDFHQWSAGGGNFQGEQECRSVWRSIKTEGGVSAASLFRAARDAGWMDTKSQAKPMQSRQIERTAPEPSKPAPYEPASLWNACKPATAAHEYVDRKLGLPDGLRVYSGSLTIAAQSLDGALVLPCLSLSGEMASLQFIPPEGKKVFLPRVRLPADACLIIGDIREGRPLYLVEGIGQAWSAHQATSCAAIVCFGWGRVAGVAEALRVKHPAARLVIAPDAGKEAQAAEIARKIRGAFCEMPAGSPRNFDLNDLHQSESLQAVASLLQQAKEPPQRFRLLTPAELAHLPPLAWRIRGVLPKTGIAALFGPSGSGKSFLALDMLAAMAEGRDWFGCRVTPCPVLYSALEGEAGISQRVKAHQMKNGRLPDAFRFMLQGLDIRKPADRADLVSAARGCGLSDGVLCIDTLNRAAPGADENDSAAMGEIIAAAKSLQGELGGLVLLIHHTGKDQTKGLRGHSSLHAALDAAIAVNREGERREWVTAKAKDGADDQGHPFRLQVVEIDTDEEGEPITSCVVIAEEHAGDVIRRALPPKSGNQRIIWDALGDAFRSAGSIAPEGAPKDLPPGRPCMSLEDAIAATRGRLVCEAKRQTERTQAAITGLLNRGLLHHREGWLWCA